MRQTEETLGIGTPPSY